MGERLVQSVAVRGRTPPLQCHRVCFGLQADQCRHHPEGHGTHLWRCHSALHCCLLQHMLCRVHDQGAPLCCSCLDAQGNCASCIGTCSLRHVQEQPHQK